MNPAKNAEQQGDMQRILIVEDDEVNRKFFRDILGANGFETIEARSGLSGVHEAVLAIPNLILMDIQMPGMDGMEAVNLLKADSTTRNIPVIALTGYAIKGDRERILAWGFDDYLSKPVDIDVLLDKIRSLLPA